MSTAPLFLVDAVPAAGPLVLDGPEGRHAATVKRLRVGELVQVADGRGGLGEAVLLADGRGGLAHAVVESAGRDTVLLSITSRESLAAPCPRVVRRSPGR